VTIDLRQGDCLDVLRTIDTNTIDAIVTDPPYGLSFMGKRWDYDVPSVEVWYECLRVLKPGGHLLAFAGTRTQHRMAVRIEDAGFEIRDMIAWVYGSGFPKSLDVSKAIDKRGGNAHLTAEIGAALKAARKSRGITATEADRTYCGGVTLWSWYEGRPAGQQMPTAEVMARVAADWPELQRYADLIAEAEREVVGQHETDMGGLGGERLGQKCGDITAPATPEAQQWAGWGTALKPALEPITVARKPLAGTVAANVLEHGTGALNVDGCRVGAEARPVMVRTETVVSATAMSGQSTGATSSGELTTAGRWPANLIHDGSEEPAALLGTAARFFYCAKASRSDRGDGNNHPTVKPTDLMRYLCRLVTPPGGTVLDPFMGSGSTGKAAALEGFHFLGIEREAQYLDIARARIRAVVDAAPLFAGKP
jgi:hypothetical protein